MYKRQPLCCEGIRVRLRSAWRLCGRSVPKGQERQCGQNPVSYTHLDVYKRQVLDDLNLIIRDIREAHKKDSESAPQTTVANELKENLEAVENFKGSRDEKLVVLYCKQLGINYKNLSDEEFRWLIRILKKSKKMGTPISQRKKR